LWLRGRPVEAVHYYRQAVDEARRILGPAHPSTASAREDLDRVIVTACGQTPGDEAGESGLRPGAVIDSGPPAGSGRMGSSHSPGGAP
jgi:hypothetical protein